MDEKIKGNRAKNAQAISKVNKLIKNIINQYPIIAIYPSQKTLEFTPLGLKLAL